MDAISYTQARANFAKTLDHVVDDHAPVIITRQGEGAVVMLSLEDYKALEETAYLLRSPANAAGRPSISWMRRWMRRSEPTSSCPCPMSEFLSAT